MKLVKEILGRIFAVWGLFLFVFTFIAIRFVKTLNLWLHQNDYVQFMVLVLKEIKTYLFILYC